MNIDDILKFFRSKVFTVIIIAIFGLALLVGVFTLGTAMGYRKARFSYAWGENYNRNFGGPREGFMGNFSRDFGGKDLIDAHGTFGQIMKIEGSTLVIKGPDNVEKLVLIKNDTTIQRLRGTIGTDALKINDSVVIIGEPNDSGQIEAKFIRVMPFPSPSLRGR